MFELVKFWLHFLYFCFWLASLSGLILKRTVKAIYWNHSTKLTNLLTCTKVEGLAPENWGVFQNCLGRLENRWRGTRVLHSPMRFREKSRGEGHAARQLQQSWSVGRLGQLPGGPALPSSPVPIPHFTPHSPDFTPDRHSPSFSEKTESGSIIRSNCYIRNF